MHKIDRRSFMKQSSMTLAAGLTGALAGLPGRQVLGSSQKNHPGTSGEKKRPNVVFILSDDHRWDVMSCAGNPYIETPNLDRLASEGCLFENAFATSAVCTPCRGTILTGKYPNQCGTLAMPWTNNTFLNQETPFPALLHEAGYKAAHIGKWHLGEGNLPKPGYDYWAGFNWIGEYFDTEVWINGEKRRFEGYSDDILSELAAEYIGQQSNSETPFCLFLGIKAPHLDFKYPPRHENAFDDIEIPKPLSYYEDYSKSGKPREMADGLLRIESYPTLPHTFGGSWDRYVKSYYRSVLAIDDAVGRVMDALNQAGIADDTILIYTSDHGYNLGEHGLSEKHFAYESSIRIPMLMRYPRMIQAGTRRQEMVTINDIAPTLLDLCGAEVPEDMNGISWRPLFEEGGQEVDSWREDFMFQIIEGGPAIPAQIAVRTSRYKLIRYQSLPYEELYDLQTDPYEMKNLIDAPEYSRVREEMRQRLDRLVEETGWAKYISHPIERCMMLGPVSAEEADSITEVVVQSPFDLSGHKVEIGNRAYSWSILNANDANTFDIGSHSELEEHGFIYMAFQVELLWDRDPYTQITMTPWKSYEGYANGSRFIKAEEPTGPGLPMIKAIGNPYLSRKQNLIVLKIPRAGTEGIALSLHAPMGSINLQ